MRQTLTIALLCLAVFSTPVLAQEQAEASSNPHVVIETSKGKIVVELFADKAPKTVENFLNYTKSGFFDGTIFHRVIPNFMIQGGGLTADMRKKETDAPVQNESDNGVKNDRGTLAMARTGDPHSATAQFFINTKNNDSLNHSQRGWGYTVFGKVVEGMGVVDAISATPTKRMAGRADVPVQTVTITKVSMKG